MSKKLKALAGSESTVLKLGEYHVPCYVLENEARVISGRGMQKTLGFSSTSSGLALSNLVNSRLTDYIPETAINVLNNPFEFDRLGKGGSAPSTYGYDATILIDICDALIQARKAERLTKTQNKYAEHAEAIIRSVAKVGIIALIDEATGYQATREKDALQKILDKFLKDEANRWSKTFPDQFWEKLLKVKGYPSYIALKRPSFVGHWVNDIIYSRLAPDIKSKLKEVKPRTEKVYRKNKHHQFCTEEHGVPELKEHLSKVMVLMDAASNDNEFKRLLNRSLPKYGNTLELDF